ncbi:MAG: helix-turn-helix domain-containing protein [Pikeienuella sp.]
MSSFGIRFGALVRERRGVEGMTQQALAIAAFGDPMRKSRISDLEKGKIANPQQGTVDALAVALNLTADDIAACRDAGAGMDPRLLEILSLQFGHDNPGASAEEHEAFLREKAKDYRALTARMADLRKMDARMDNLLSAAEAALAAGDFDGADDRLADAEEMQQAERTLVEVQKQAAIRTQRADNALLRGDAGRAYEHFAAAAGFVVPFAAVAAAEMRHVFFVRLYNHALRFSGPGFEGAAALSRENLKTYPREGDPQNWAMTQNNLAIALCDQAARVEGEAGAALLAEAVTAYRAALEVRTRADHPVAWAMTQENLAIALRDMADQMPGEAAAHLSAARALVCGALEVYDPAHMPFHHNGAKKLLTDIDARIAALGE